VALSQRSGDKGIRVTRLVKLLPLTFKAMPYPEND